MTSRHKIIWVERLGNLGVFYWAFKSYWVDIEIRFDEHQTPARISCLSKFLNRFFKKTIFIEARLCLNQTDASGMALDYRRQEILSQALDAFGLKYAVGDSIDFQYMMRSYAAFYLQLSFRAAFLAMVEYEASKIKDADQEIVLLGGPGMDVLIEFVQLDVAKIRQSCPLKAYADKIIFIALLTIRLLFNRLLSFGKPPFKKEREAVFIEYPCPQGFWRIFLNHLSTLHPKDYRLTLYWDRRDTPWSESQGMKNRGFDVLNLKGYRNMSLGFKEAWKALVYALAKIKLRKPLWMFLLYYHNQILFYTYLRLYKEHQTKVLIQHQDIRWIQGPQAQAIKAAGGIMIGIHWSNYLYADTPPHLTPHQVYFVWGKAHRDILMHKGNTCAYILPCGVWVGDPPMQGQSQGLFGKGIDFTFAIFDDSCSYNIYTSPESLGEFYNAAVELLEENTNWGAVIKSRYSHMDELVPFWLPELLVRIRALMEQKRLVWLDQAEHTVIAAARSVDLSLCLGINSAGIVCASYGFPAIHWDHVGWKHYPHREELLRQKIVFSNLADFKKAVAEFYAGNGQIGDLSFLIKYYNFFGDQKGLSRMTDFVDLFMKALKDNNQRDTALAETVSLYSQKNGVKEEFF